MQRGQTTARVWCCFLLCWQAAGVYSVVVSWLKYAPCIARAMSVLSVVSGFTYVHNTKPNILGKKSFKKNGHELCEARTHAIKSKIGHRDHLTILPKIHILFFHRASQTRDTSHAWHNMHSTAKEIGGDDWRRIAASHTATSHSSKPRICHTLVVWPAASCLCC